MTPDGKSDVMSMKQLRGLDAAFLYMETPSQHMHISATMILEPKREHALDNGDQNGDQASTAETVATKADGAARRLSHVLVARLLELPAFRRSLTNALLRLTHPAWIDAPHFDPGDHLRYETLPSPGTLDQLADLVGGIAATPLDRSRPLWELWTVNGLEDGRIAVVVKVHHAMLDGVSSLEVLSRLFTTEPSGPEQMPIDAPIHEDRRPSSTQCATSVLGSIARAPANLANALVQTAYSLLPLARSSIRLARSTLRPSLPFSSPRTSLNHALTPGRAVAFGRVPLDSLKRVGHAFSVTVNDVVLAACTLALRDYLRERGERPHSIRAGSWPSMCRPHTAW
jgi:WS/DGAT/MGAT family acyltransferase